MYECLSGHFSEQIQVYLSECFHVRTGRFMLVRAGLSAGALLRITAGLSGGVDDLPGNKDGCV